jgi:hypothetical protein
MERSRNAAVRMLVVEVEAEKDAMTPEGLDSRLGLRRTT